MADRPLTPGTIYMLQNLDTHKFTGWTAHALA
jgi:hypothetical protein